MYRRRCTVANPKCCSTLSNNPSKSEEERTVKEHSLGQRALAETLGTALLVLVGPGSVIATLILAGKSVPAVTGADLLGISFAFGLVITALERERDRSEEHTSELQSH